jgi:23S rRNA (pseudouridine1915-N3)-methyltransferase
MLLNILSIGNKLSEWESAGITYYLKQLPKNVDINFINIKGQQHPKKSKNEILKSESEMIISKIPTENFIISWDSNGEKLNSIELSQFFEKAMTNNIKICFIIGGSFGLSKQIIENSDRVISASSFTIPHKLFRLILVEQIYRAHTIISNMPYHK